MSWKNMTITNTITREYGLGIIDALSTFNNISNYFHQSKIKLF